MSRPLCASFSQAQQLLGRRRLAARPPRAAAETPSWGPQDGPASASWANSLPKPRLRPTPTFDSSASSFRASGKASAASMAPRVRIGTNSNTAPLLRPADSRDPEDGPLTLLASTSRSQSDDSTSGEPGTSSSGNQPGSFQWQYLVALCTLSVVICYADRSNISTAVLPMAQEFGWDKAFQGIVLSSFFGGYALTQILGGSLADRFGGKLVLAGGVALWSLFTACTPLAAAQGTVPLLCARVMLGIGEGVAFPSIHSLISRNVPQQFQSTAVGIVTAASYAGTALAFGLAPVLITRFGWPYVFYAFAAMALLWLPLWLPITTRSQPANRIATSAPSGSGTPAADAAAAAAAAAAPKASSSGKGGPMVLDNGFWALMKRREVWAICVAQYTQSWGMYGLLNWLPTFFSDYYKIEIADLGSYTLLPYIVQGGLGVVSGIMADRLISSGWSVRTVRSVLQVLGMVGPAACLLLAVSPVVGASPSTASTLITIGLGFSALSLGGVSASHLDIAPRHAGVIFGAGNTAATLAGFLSVPFTGFLLQATGSWPLVFGITAAHYVVGAVIWSMWVGGEALPEDSIDVEPAAATAASGSQ